MTCSNWPRPRRRRPRPPAPIAAIGWPTSIRSPSASTASPAARGNRTYLKIKLDLKAEQVAAWDAFAKASDTADVKDTARCNALPSDMKERPNYVDRLTMEETYMKARVERIEAVKPSLTAFYDTLSPEQKAVLDRPRPMGGGGPSSRRAAVSRLLRKRTLRGASSRRWISVSASADGGRRPNMAGQDPRRLRSGRGPSGP